MIDCDKVPKIFVKKPIVDTPNMFEIEESKLRKSILSGEGLKTIFFGEIDLQSRKDPYSELNGKAIFLSRNYCWKIVEDSLGEICLISWKK